MSTVKIPSVTFNNGLTCPALGLGTWLAAPGEVEEIVKKAIDIGYRHFDCAWLYGNEKEIGNGVRSKIKEGVVKREDLFITTKLWNIYHEKEEVVPALKVSLENFGLDYVDLYLVHWPCAQKKVGHFDYLRPFDGTVNIDYDYVDTWKAMEECVNLGLTKNIGLSNFNSNQIQRILDAATIKPVMNQIEVSPLLNQKPLIKYCRDRDIHVTAYAPFGSPARTWKKSGDPTLDLQDPKLTKIGKKYNKSETQVILRYLIQLGTIPVPKTLNEERLRLNLDVFDFVLSSEDMAIMDTFDCNGRVCPGESLFDNVHYPFN